MSNKFNDPPKYPGEYSTSVHDSGQINLKMPHGRLATSQSQLDRLTNRDERFKLYR